MVMANPLKKAANGLACCDAQQKKPRGRYTARLLKRLPITRFRRTSSIGEAGNGCIQI
jgi:hypothetical protein